MTYAILCSLQDTLHSDYLQMERSTPPRRSLDHDRGRGRGAFDRSDRRRDERPDRDRRDRSEKPPKKPVCDAWRRTGKCAKFRDNACKAHRHPDQWAGCGEEKYLERRKADE